MDYNTIILKIKNNDFIWSHEEYEPLSDDSTLIKFSQYYHQITISKDKIGLKHYKKIFFDDLKNIFKRFFSDDIDYYLSFEKNPKYVYVKYLNNKKIKGFSEFISKIETELKEYKYNSIKLYYGIHRKFSDKVYLNEAHKFHKIIPHNENGFAIYEFISKDKIYKKQGYKTDFCLNGKEWIVQIKQKIIMDKLNKYLTNPSFNLKDILLSHDQTIVRKIKSDMIDRGRICYYNILHERYNHNTKSYCHIADNEIFKKKFREIKLKKLLFTQ